MNAPRMTDRDLALLHQDVRTGHACLITFEGSNGTAWLDVMGPRGVRPVGDFLVAPVPTLRLWSQGAGEPHAVAAANDGFDRGLRTLAESARPLLFRDEAALLADILAVIQAAVRAGPARLPVPGHRLTTAGTPDLRAWASALSLGDLQAALAKAVA